METRPVKEILKDITVLKSISDLNLCIQGLRFELALENDLKVSHDPKLRRQVVHARRRLDEQLGKLNKNFDKKLQEFFIYKPTDNKEVK